MKKVLVIGMVVIILLSIATGVAAAQKTFVLETNPAGQPPPAFTDFQLIYDAIGANEGQAMVSSTYAVYMVYDPLSATNFSVTGLGAGLGFMMDTSALVAPNGVQASVLNFGGIPVPDGSVLATFHSDTPTTMQFDIDNVLFTIDVDGTGMSGRALETAGQLNPGEGATTPGFSEPVPVAPIPEIITIVLVSIGVIALGGYVWYRRRNMASIAA